MLGKALLECCQQKVYITCTFRYRICKTLTGMVQVKHKVLTWTLQAVYKTTTFLRVLYITSQEVLVVGGLCDMSRLLILIELQRQLCSLSQEMNRNLIII
jgi:hypothetical protein